jgi:hypothetical protein
MAVYAKGDRVAQPQYGPGTVTDVNEFHTVVDFDDHGIRRFSTAMVTLERSKTPPPERPKTRAKRTKKTVTPKAS